MAKEQKYPNLFKPLRIGSVVAKNRINFEPTDLTPVISPVFNLGSKPFENQY